MVGVGLGVAHGDEQGVDLSERGVVGVGLGVAHGDEQGVDLSERVWWGLV